MMIEEKDENGGDVVDRKGIMNKGDGGACGGGKNEGEAW